MAMLTLEQVHSAYGAVQALKGISLRLEQGEIVTLVGSNGAGKSTTLRTISGIIRPQQGAITFQGARIDGLPSHEVTALGIAHVPEGRKVFPRLTVAENLEMGAYLVREKAVVARRLEEVFARFPRLKERQNQQGGTLSGGEQQMLAIGRALMMGPKLLMLDEPSMGLAPLVVEQIFATITELNRAGVTILLVEQNARQALQVAHRGYVIQTGDIALEGPADSLLRNPLVQEAYLGAG
ncbi:MAG TPA: ABC transporter ATP-binding protein [Symbiobacteriaceae bacterium]|jgi:branched-chain amino acid transport system ATP-binding protein|nr:ABC transporter ATP-binding protein [Symbiobacteriaceae bacterium]